MGVIDYIIDNFDYDKYIIQNYRMLNKISLPIYRKKFPYNIFETTIPTYKEVDMIISRKKFFGGNYESDSDSAEETSEFYEEDTVDVILMD
jgi:hypothetical protein